jgi:hypothetical protein
MSDVLVKPLQVLQHVRFSMAYMQRFCPELLQGAPLAKLKLIFQETTLIENLDELAKVPDQWSTDLAVRKRLLEYHKHALNAIESAAARQEAAKDAPPRARSPEFLRWAATYVLGRDPALDGAVVAQECLRIQVQCHHLVVHQLAEWWLVQHSTTGSRFIAPLTPQKAITQIRDKTARLLQEHSSPLLKALLTTGEQVSGLAALTGVWYLLRRNVPGQDRVVNWEELLPSLLPDVQRYLFELASRNELALAAVPALYAGVSQPKNIERLRPRACPLRLVGNVQRLLQLLQNFSDRLLVQQKTPERSGLIVMGHITRREVERFSSLKSPLSYGAESNRFRDSLIEDLEVSERKLFEATTMPRPTFHDCSLRWSRERFTFMEGAHFPLSELCLRVMLYCHNLLGSSRGSEELERNRQRVEAVPAMSGDMFMIYQTLTALRAVWGAQRLQNGNARWREILPALTPAEQSCVRLLSRKSPIVRICVPDLEEILHESRAEWLQLDDFLDDRAAESLRDFAAGCLVAEVERDPNLIGVGGRRVLQDLLASDKIGGALMVAEFFHALLLNRFSQCDRYAVSFNEHGPRKDQYEGLVRASNDFIAWFFDLDQPVPQAVFTLLVELLAKKIQFATDPSADRQVALLRHHWRAISTLTTRGLVQRPWFFRSQRMLWVFWLNFCVLAFQRFEVLPDGLDTGRPTLDNLGRFGCWLTAQLRRTLKAHDDGRERRREAERRALLRQDNSSGESHVVNDQFEVIRRRVGDVEKSPPLKFHVTAGARFKMSLLVRRMISVSEDRVCWDDDRIDEVAAQHL